MNIVATISMVDHQTNEVYYDKENHRSSGRVSNKTLESGVSVSNKVGIKRDDKGYIDSNSKADNQNNAMASNKRTNTEPKSNRNSGLSYKSECKEHTTTTIEKSPISAEHDRPYLLSKAVFNRLRIIMIIGMLSANFPWRWNQKTKRIDRWSPGMFQLWKLHWHITVIQSICMFLYHMHCLKGMYSRNLESYRGIFAYSTILYWYSCHLGYRSSMMLYEDDMRRYINRLQDFNEEYVSRYLIYADKGTEFGAGRVIMKLSIPAAASQIANSLFLFLITPSAPYYLTSMIKPLRWYSLIPGAFHELTLIGQTIITYLTISWLQVAHTSTMEFWLGEMHKDTKGKYTLDTLRQSKIVIKMYRALQLMSSNFNDCMAPLCIPVWKFSVAFGFIPCAFLWIRSMNRIFLDEFPGILLYPFGVFNCITMGFGCLAMAAKMYNNANGFIYSWNKTTRKELKKLLLSCPALRVKVGKFYFITTATTVTFFEILIHYVIDCIITFP